MPKIEIYTTSICPFCHAAKKLLNEKGVDFSEISLSKEPHLRDRMIERADGARTVPQIFIDNAHIGGCDDLYALDAKGNLDPLLTP
ncbi:MAG: Glutaredoxin 3 [Alphaproteobacteria bacterium]|nr:MAG: Glutaredoxin 3 [Alphaproteobacteria bacterium]